MANPLLISKNPNAAKEEALRAARAKASSPANDAAIQKWIDPAKAKERIRIEFDDSGSMSGSKIEQAREGTIEYFRNCVPNQTSISVHFLCTEDESLAKLNSNLIEAASQLKDVRFRLGGTPLFGKMKEILQLEPSLTRMVVFTDGSPTDSLVGYNPSGDSWLLSADVCIELAKALSCSIDTIFFGEASTYTERERHLLAYIAEQTGGYFMVFDPAKVNFRSAFKYLAPTNRLMLSSESVRKEIEEGKRS